MLLGVQILGLVFGVFLLYFTFLNFKRRELTKPEFALWGAVWVVFLYIVFFPNALDFVAETLSISRTLDFFTITGFMFLIALGFYNYMMAVQTRNKLEKAVRALAIESAERKK